MPHPVILFFDPPNAFALVQGEALLARGHWSMKNRDDFWLVQKVLEVLEGLPRTPDIVGVEGQYLHVYGDDAPHVRRGKQESSLVLSYRAGLIAATCMVVLRKPVKKKDPEEWQRTMVGGGKREERKKMSMLKARAMTREQLTEDECDAYLMAVHERLPRVGRTRRRGR